MTAEYVQRRSQTARELGKRFNRSPRTIRRVMAESRSDYESRAGERRAKIRELRATGMTYREIAAEIGCAIGTVHNALKNEKGS